IQAAIDDSDTVNGHVIEVADGTYTEQITIDKELTVKSASNPVIDGEGMLGPGVHITADDVTFQGFTITDFTCTTSSGIGAVWVEGDRATIDSNIIHNIVTTGDPIVNPAGIGIDVKAVDDAIVTNNEIHDVGSIGIRIRGDYDNDAIQVTGTRVEGNIVYKTGNSGVLVAGNVVSTTIKNNEIYDSLAPTPYSLLVIGGPGTGGAPDTVLIEGNTIYNGYGNVVLGGVTNVIVTGNTIRDAIPHYTNSGIKGKNIYIRDWDSTNVITTDVTITNNNITGADGYSVFFKYDGSGDASQMAATTHINYNDIQGNTEYGIDNAILTDVDAEHNWWGNSTGPFDDSNDTETGGLYNPSGLGDKASDNVDYDPWLKASKDAAPVRFNGQPEEYAATANPTLSLTTDRPATCKYSETSEIDYDSMAGTFTTTGGTSHEVGLTGLSESLHTYYVKCKSGIDGEPVNSADYEISFTVDVTPPEIDARSPGINAVGVDATADVTVGFSEDLSCSGDWSSCILLSDGGPVSGTASYADATATLTFDPTAPLASNTVYTVTLTGITDLAGNSLSGTLSWTFTTATYYSMDITNGWNLVSIPTVPIDTGIEEVLGDAEEDIDSVWTYDAVDDEWHVYHTDESPDDLTTMTAGYGYWISATGGATIEGYGSLFSEGQTPPQRQLTGGWNLIGYYQNDGIDSIEANYALSTLADNYCDATEKWWSSLVGYDNTGKSFTTKSWNQDMSPGEAFWIFMKSSDITYMYGPGESSESCT
ncbi:MAG: Ig-like domain-containing protein, partial [Candidatus Altiarchaeota archaeon]|nr:Ig-like domain-containing protein [Candidatus Altiarchaeota archaeon]